MGPPKMNNIKITKYDSSKQYKLRQPKSAWLIFSAAKRAELKKKFPELKFGELSKKLGDAWNEIKKSPQLKSKWDKKAKKEKAEYEKVKKQFDEHQDYSKVPGQWLADNKEKKKKKSESKKDKSASPKKKESKKSEKENCK